jgi:mono/diheme cytochrome c family protein
MAAPLNNGEASPTAVAELPATKADRRILFVLLAASGITLAFLVAAMVRENFFTEWRGHQRTYRQMLAASLNEQQRRLAENFAIELRQIDVPSLGVTDRCVSCHVGLDNPAMAGAPRPYCPHSGDYLKHHPVEKYGCTICHRGQGAATNFHEAKASDAFWDYPLLPVGLTQASCGACHTADSPLMAKHAPKLAHGRELFLDRGCQSCHKQGGVGGQLGPVLDGIGMKIRHQLPMAHVQGEHTLANWLSQHFANPQGIVANSQMRPPRLTPAENEALTIYMLSLQNRDLPQNYTPGDRVAAWDADLHRKTTDPAVLYNRFCVSCHGDGTYGQWDKFFKRFNPAIRGPGLRAVADKDYLRAAIEQGRPGTLMPAWNKNAGGLTGEQVSALVDYLAAGDERPPQKLQQVPEPLTRGSASRGGELFTQQCAGCHRGVNRVAPALENPVFQKTASDRFIAATICNGRKDTAMPAFQRPGTACLTDDEIRDLLAYVRSLVTKPGKP